MKEENTINTLPEEEKNKDEMTVSEDTGVLPRVSARKRAKSGVCDFTGVLKAVVVFSMFTAVLGVIGFGVVWVLENENRLRVTEDLKPEVSEVVRAVDEKVSQNLSSEEKQENEEKNSSEQGSNEEKEKSLPVLALNASGVSGSAGKAVEALKAAGYVLARADNASSSGYSGITVCYADDTLREGAEKMAEALKKSYTTVSVKKAEAADEKREKIVVIVGK